MELGAFAMELGACAMELGASAMELGASAMKLGACAMKLGACAVKWSFMDLAAVLVASPIASHSCAEGSVAAGFICGNVHRSQFMAYKFFKY
jgi:hypothetical protein